MIACACRPGLERDNCPACEGTGERIDFVALRRATCGRMDHAWASERSGATVETCGRCGAWRGTGDPITEVSA